MRLTLSLAVLALGLLFAPAAQAQNVHLVTQLGGKCLDVEGGGSHNGALVIGYACNPGAANQLWWFNQNGTVVQRGKCLTMGTQGLMLWDCQAGATTQQFKWSNGRLVGFDGSKCVDLTGGARSWSGNQNAKLAPCNGQPQQQWLAGVVAPRSRVSGANYVQAGQQSSMRGLPDDISREIARQGARAVAAGGANVVAAGGANVVAAGGMNLIVPMSNVIAPSQLRP